MEFFGRLVHFWTGMRKLDTTREHQVIFIGSQVPMASTCFYQLKLPSSIQSKEELYRKLVFAVYNVEAGIGMYGGRRGRR